jgi:hypothetical protein
MARDPEVGSPEEEANEYLETTYHQFWTQSGHARLRSRRNPLG